MKSEQSVQRPQKVRQLNPGGHPKRSHSEFLCYFISTATVLHLELETCRHRISPTVGQGLEDTDNTGLKKIPTSQGRELMMTMF